MPAVHAVNSPAVATEDTVPPQASRLPRHLCESRRRGYHTVLLSYDGVQATLVLAGGTWKVSKQTVTEGRCAPGSRLPSRSGRPCAGVVRCRCGRRC